MDADEVIKEEFEQDTKPTKDDIERVKNAFKKEKIKYTKIFKKIDKDTYNLVENLINEAAFMSVTLEENRKYIEENGVKEFYMNGKGQFGFKESVESKNYNTMIKNYTNVIKQLVDFLPKEEKKNVGEDLLKFMASGTK